MDFSKVRKYERQSNYFFGLGTGYFFAGLLLIPYNQRSAWIWGVGGVVMMIIAGVFGTLARRELSKEK